MSARDPDTAAVLEELADTLTALRRELADADAGTGTEAGAGAGADGDRTPDRSPPSTGDLLRFTEEYTIPTVIATLEATIAALELLRGLLRLVDPDRRAVDRSTGGAGGRLATAGDSAVGGVERALSELRTALSAADLPDDETSRRLIEDARTLSETVENRLDGARQTVEGKADGADQPERPAARGTESIPERDRSRGISIDVREEGADGSERTTAGDGEDGEDGDDADVDVEAELESIREEVGRDDDDGGDAQSSTGSNR